ARRRRRSGRPAAGYERSPRVRRAGPGRDQGSGRPPARADAAARPYGPPAAPGRRVHREHRGRRLPRRHPRGDRQRRESGAPGPRGRVGARCGPPAVHARRGRGDAPHRPEARPAGSRCPGPARVPAAAARVPGRNRHARLPARPGCLRGSQGASLERSRKALRSGRGRRAEGRRRARQTRSQARPAALLGQRGVHHPRPGGGEDRRPIQGVLERLRAATAAHLEDLPGHCARQEEIPGREQGLHQPTYEQRALDDPGHRAAPPDDAQGHELHRRSAARILREGRRVPEAAHPAGSRRRHQHAREHRESCDEREVRADPPGPPPAQVLLLERPLDHHRRGRQRPGHPRANPEDGGRRGPQEPAHRPANRGDVRAEGRQDRAADRREVPRPAEHPPGPHAQTAVSLATSAALPEVSVLVPAKDEAENPPEFVRQAREALLPLPYSCEIAVIDDGSRDGTADVLRDLATKHPFLRVMTHRSQRGIADALASGAGAARGRVLVFYPADLQYRPSDIPGLVQPILDDAADVVTGTKQGPYEKRFVSWVYNGLCRWLFGVRVTDLNSVKAYRREVMDGLTTRPDWHRFMVVIAAAQGFRLAERPVPLLPRRAGKSKFGLGRIPVGVLDLVSVWFQLRFGRKPLLFFGVPGALLIFLGFLVAVYALIERYVYLQGNRAFLYLVLLLVLAGLM